MPLVEGRRALRGAGAEPERLATRAWGMSGPVRIQEQNRTEQRERESKREREREREILSSE